MSGTASGLTLLAWGMVEDNSTGGSFAALLGQIDEILDVKPGDPTRLPAELRGRVRLIRCYLRMYLRSGDESSATGRRAVRRMERLAAPLEDYFRAWDYRDAGDSGDDEIVSAVAGLAAESAQRS